MFNIKLFINCSYKPRLSIILYTPNHHVKFILIVQKNNLTGLIGEQSSYGATTSDNGKTFSYHEEIENALDTEFYFANPYQSWQRGLNEHTNGLIREYFPKKMPFSEITDEQIVGVQNKLNRRPRKILGYKTPAEVFFDTISKSYVAV